MDADEAEDYLDDAAQEPERAMVDGNLVASRDLDQLARWADRKAAASSASNANRGLFFTKLVPPGTT